MKRSKFLVFAMVALVATALILGLWWVVMARSVPAWNACVSNLRQIVALKQQWQNDHPAAPVREMEWDDIRPYMGPTALSLQCPAGGTYVIGKPGEAPVCTIGGRGHSLPQSEINVNAEGSGRNKQQSD